MNRHVRTETHPLEERHVLTQKGSLRDFFNKTRPKASQIMQPKSRMELYDSQNMHHRRKSTSNIESIRLPALPTTPLEYKTPKSPVSQKVNISKSPMGKTPKPPKTPLNKPPKTPLNKPPKTPVTNLSIKNEKWIEKMKCQILNDLNQKYMNSKETKPIKKTGLFARLTQPKETRLPTVPHHYQDIPKSPPIKPKKQENSPKSPPIKPKKQENSPPIQPLTIHQKKPLAPIPSETQGPKSKCTYCGRLVDTPKMSFHLNSCTKAKQIQQAQSSVQTTPKNLKKDWRKAHGNGMHAHSIEELVKNVRAARAYKPPGGYQTRSILF